MSVKTKMTAIANAIRTKTGQASTEKLGLDDMATQIKTLAEPFWKDNAKGSTTQTSVTDSDLDVIRPYAFYGLKGVTTMTFKNENLTEIGESAFKGCSVKNLTLPSGITSLSKEMFADSSLTSFSAVGVTEVGEGCFKNSDLTSTPKLSEDIVEIPKEFCYMHNRSNSISSLSIPTECVTIGPAAYYSTGGVNYYGVPTSLTRKQIFRGASVETIGSLNFTIGGFFVSTTSLYTKDVFVFPKLKTIKHECFMGNINSSYLSYYEKGYYNFNFPLLETIGHKNFQKIPFKTITDVEFPSLVSMGQECFTDNTYLTIVNLSKLTTFKQPSEETEQISSYDNYYKADDYDLYLFDVSGSSAARSPFANCTALTSITLPALLDFNIALEGCTALTTIDLTAVTSITTFETTSLTNLILRNETPPTLNVRRVSSEDVYFPDTISIYVPDPTLYENLDNWSYYYSLGCIKSLSEYTG